jgi:hypothetical protein
MYLVVEVFVAAPMRIVVLLLCCVLAFADKLCEASHVISRNDTSVEANVKMTTLRKVHNPLPWNS